MDNTPRVIRSLAYVPAHDEDRILAAAEVGLDAIGFDLEDLTPAADKQRARDGFRALAKELHSRGIIVMARTNGFPNGMCEADLEAIVCPELHCVNVPKTESAADVLRFCELLDKAESRNGLADHHTLIRPVVETAAGIKWAYEIASASDRIAYMGGVSGGFWGDLGRSVGTILSDDGTESLYLRSKILVDVRVAGVPFPIGGGAIARTDPESIRAFALQNKHLGYTGFFSSTDPRTVAVVNGVFTPTAAEIEDWLETVPLLEAAKAEGRIAFRMGERMYDVAGLDRVIDQLALARRLGLLT